MSYWNVEVSTRVPRLESSYIFIYKLEPLYFVTCGFLKAFIVKGGNFAEHIFVKCPQNKNNFFIDSQNDI